MRSRPFVHVVGVALLASACEKQPPQLVGNPPSPEPPPPGAAPGGATRVIPEVGGPATGGPGATAPDALPEGVIPPPRNPPAPLATWDSVGSGHPEGATNPPSPVLIVTREPLGCYKGWEGGMRPPAPEVLRTGGRVVDTPDSVGRATHVECPPGQPAALLEKWDEAYPPSASPEK